MARTFTITTPENVTIEYQIAGAGSRGGAAMIDLLIQALMYALLVYLVYISVTLSGTFALTAAITGWFLINVGYSMFFETIWNGQSPGKRLLGLRVVREEGLPVDTSAVVIRNLFRVIDFLPSLYGVGLVSMVFTSNSKRLGDLAGGTIVVRERRVQPKLEPAQSPELSFQPDSPLDIPPLGPQEMEALRRFVERQAELPEDVREDIAERIARPLFERIGYYNHTGSYCEALVNIYQTCLAQKSGR